MTYRLDVVPRRQTSMYSCWSAATPGIVWDQTLPLEFCMVGIVDPAEGRRTISPSRLQQWVTPELGHRNVLSKQGAQRPTPREIGP